MDVRRVPKTGTAGAPFALDGARLILDNTLLPHGLACRIFTGTSFHKNFNENVQNKIQRNCY